jgi:hypothetical protein
MLHVPLPRGSGSPLLRGASRVLRAAVASGTGGMHCLRCRRERPMHSYVTPAGSRRNQCCVCLTRYRGVPSEEVFARRPLRLSREARAERRAQQELEAAGQIGLWEDGE